MAKENKGFEISNSMVLTIVSVIGAVVAAFAGLGAYQTHQQEAKALAAGDDDFEIDPDVVHEYVVEDESSQE